MAYDYRAELERLQGKLFPQMFGAAGVESLKWTNLPETLQVYQHSGYEEPRPLYTAQWQLDRSREAAERLVEAGFWTEESPYYKYFTSLKLGQEPNAPAELRLRPREKYDDWVKRLVAAGYRPATGAAGPGAVELSILQTRAKAGEEVPSYGRSIPTQPTQPTVPTPQPAYQPTPTPQISFAPAAAQQPAYQPTTAYQSTYYQANGYKPYGQQDTFGDKPFAYAYQRPRLQQSYTGI